MRKFIIAAIGTILLLLLLIGFRNGFWRQDSLPFDSEQKHLNSQFVINFSHVVAENTPKGLAASKFAELAEKKSDGRIQVEVYPNSLLYSDDDELRALQNGDIQMIAPSFSKMTRLIPKWEVLDLPYLFRDYEDVRRVFTGKAGDALLDMLDKEDIKGLALWSNGFKQITTANKPVRELADLKGLTIRTMDSDMLAKQFELAGARPVKLNFDLVYSRLKNHSLDGEENTISNIYSKGFYQLQKYMTISDHGFLGYAVMMNKDFWKSLPEDLQQDVQEAMEEATLWNLKQSEQMNKDDYQKIKATSGMDIHTLTQQEQKEWEKTFRALHDYYRGEVDADFLKEIEKEIN
ncbi:DctP family TRAP transporter solute-binding subunit [Bacillus testis]|uniref:DctP family TRAP transporter solute-binding subunit n=1 Tax=Bacillus testis TaxID=1622072 RepID=UPI00067E73FC|nr:DctP family TRAP transporter solute-binding subunit [Bacillus testis]